MNRAHVSIGALCLLSLVVALSAGAAGQKGSAGENWPSFRGPNASGVADSPRLPEQWDVPASRHVRWKTAIPGLGHSSPVIWGDRLFVSTAISGMNDPQLKVGLYGDVTSVTDDTPHRWVVYCLDARSGRLFWEKTVVSGVPKIKRHPKSTHASSTLATDGRHVVAFFGSEGLYCLDLNGKLLWKRDFGVLEAAWYVAPDAQWEVGSSPVIYGDMVIIQCDVLHDSFLAALSIEDGHDLWRTPRADVPTWGTPAVLGGGALPSQVVVNGYKQAGGYDLKTGKEVWRLTGGGDIPVPTPVVGGGFVFLTNAHGSLSPVYAIKATATGDITLKPGETSNAHVAWSVPREGSYMATPIFYRDLLYNIRWNGVLICYEAASGKRLYQHRLGDGTAFTASPVAGDGKVYFSSEDGDVYVVKAGPTFSLVAKNPMGEVCMASPAIANGTLYFRTKSRVVAIR